MFLDEIDVVYSL